MSDARSHTGLLRLAYETIGAPDDFRSMECTPPPEMWQTVARAGLREPTASASEMTNHSHEQLTKVARPDWVAGGTISLRHTRPALAGERATYRGVAKKNVSEGARTRLVLKIGPEKPAGEVGIGVQAFSPERRGRRLRTRPGDGR